MNDAEAISEWEYLRREEWAEADQPDGGLCDWCKTQSPKLSPMRDIDEGHAGRFYSVCAPCIKRYNDRMQEELDKYDQGDL